MKLDRSVIAAIVALVAIAAAASAYYGYQVWQEQQPDAVGEGDFVEMYYIGYYENETVFSSSFTGGNVSADASFDDDASLAPFRAYMGKERPSANEYPTNWSAGDLGTIQGARLYDLPGLYDGLLGMEEGDVATIGPVPPEQAYGRPVEEAVENQTLIQSNFTGVPDQQITLGNLTEHNVTITWMPEEGATFTIPMYWGQSPVQNPYWIWKNASTVISYNDTHATVKTTPNKMHNLTIPPFWENATEVVNLTNTTVTLSFEPAVGDSFTYYGRTFTVVNVTEDTINVSVPAGNQTQYTELNKTMPWMHFNLTTHLPRVFPNVKHDYVKRDVLRAGYSFSSMAGKTVYFKVKVLKVL